MNKREKCVHIILSFMKIGTFTFGGGYAMIPMIKREMVEQKKWITEEEMVDMIAISEATPGPIMVNVATFVGSRIAGTAGALAATLGVVMPSFFMILLIAAFIRQIQHLKVVQYAFEGVRAGVIVLIVKAIGTVFAQCERDLFAYIIIGLSFLLVAIGNINVIVIIIAAGVSGIVYDRIKGEKSK